MVYNVLVAFLLLVAGALCGLIAAAALKRQDNNAFVRLKVAISVLFSPEVIAITRPYSFVHCSPEFMLKMLVTLQEQIDKARAEQDKTKAPSWAYKGEDHS